MNGKTSKFAQLRSGGWYPDQLNKNLIEISRTLRSGFFNFLQNSVSVARFSGRDQNINIQNYCNLGQTGENVRIL